MFKLIILLLCISSCAVKKQEEKPQVTSFKINKKENVIEIKYDNGDVKYMYNNKIV